MAISVNNSTLLHLCHCWLSFYIEEVLALCCVSQQRYAAILVICYAKGDKKNMFTHFDREEKWGNECLDVCPVMLSNVMQLSCLEQCGERRELISEN